MTLAEVLADARALAASGGSTPAQVAELLDRLFVAAAASAEVGRALDDVPAGRALLRFTDAPLAFEMSAGAGRFAAARADVRGAGPKVDATSTTWLGLLGGTLKPWLAFTRGLVICRAGLAELRWLQIVAERLQRAYQEPPRSS